LVVSYSVSDKLLVVEQRKIPRFAREPTIMRSVVPNEAAGMTEAVFGRKLGSPRLQPKLVTFQNPYFSKTAMALLNGVLSSARVLTSR
jgi:hypothetical protein